MMKSKKETSIKQIPKTKKRSKIKNVLKWTGLGCLLYMVVSGAFVHNVAEKVAESVNLNAFNDYIKIENTLKNKDEFESYYQAYHYTEEMFKKDMEKYRHYEKWLYQQYQKMVIDNGFVDNISEEELNKNIDENKKWEYFQSAYTNLYQKTNSIMLPIFSVYLEKNDRNYIKLNTEKEKLQYVNDYIRNNKIILLSENAKYGFVYDGKIITAEFPLLFLNVKGVIQSTDEKLFLVGKDLKQQKKYIEFKKMNAFKKLYDDAGKLVSKNGKSSYDLLFNEKNMILLPASIVYNLFNDNEFKTSKSQTDTLNLSEKEYRDLYFKLSGVDDIMINEELKKYPQTTILENVDIAYPFLK